MPVPEDIPLFPEPGIVHYFAHVRLLWNLQLIIIVVYSKKKNRMQDPSDVLF
jgi:hypothetical protein